MGGLGMGLFNPMYLLFALPGLLLGMWAQSKVKGTFNKFSTVATRRGLTGAEVARQLLDAYGLQHVRVEPVGGQLSDHYDPGNKVLRLSEPVYSVRSIAAAGVAAHEMGHALQDADGYAMLRLRSGMVPSVKIGGMIGPLMFMAGAMLRLQPLMIIGLILFAATAIFALVTLPVEFDASSRAKKLLLNEGIMGADELRGVDEVLDAAAWTYVAAAIQAIGTVLYYAYMVFGTGNRRRD